MTTQLEPISPSLLIDIEGAHISHSEEVTQLNKDIIKRSSTPFSKIRAGKFRKLFDRHTLAYKH